MATDEIILNHLKYIHSRDAARKVGLSHNYLSKLCRKGLEGSKFVDGTWYVNERSLRLFLEKKGRERRDWLQNLADKRRAELLIAAGIERSDGGFRKHIVLTRPHPIFRVRAKEYAARKIHVQKAAKLTLASFTFFIFLVSGGFAFEHIAPYGSANRVALEHSIDAARNQIAAVSSIPFIDSLASTFYKTVCLYLNTCPKDTTIAQYLASHSPQITQKPQTQVTSTAAESIPPRAPQTVVQNIVNQPIIERIKETVRTVVESGLTVADVDARLAQLDSRLSNQINAVNTSASTNTTTIQNVYQTLGAVARVDNLDDVHVTNSHWTGGAISNATITGNVTATDFSGVLGVAKGGTATSASPSYGQLLLGNSSGGYNFVATSSLGITFSSPFGKTFEISNSALSPTTTIGLLINASSTFNGGASFDRSTTTNATSTNLFATLGRFTNNIVDTLLTAAAATITNLTATTLTATNATTTRMDVFDYVAIGRIATTTIRGDGVASTIPFASSTALTVSGTSFLHNLLASASSTIGDGTQTGGLTISGGATTTGNTYVGGDLTIAGSSITIGTSTSASLVINSVIASHLIPDVNAVRDLGSAAYFWDDAYINSLHVNTISAASTTIGGTESSTFTLNSDNATADTEDATIIFYRGTVVPNALITWSSGNTRFEINQPLAVTASSTFSGNVGIGTTSPYRKLSVSGDSVFTGGNVLASYFTATSTANASTFPFASTTMISATTASTTNLVVSSAGGSGTRCLQVGTDGTVSANSSACNAAGGDAWTHPAAGQSATTSLMLFNGAASSTQFSAYTAYFGGTATSTFTSAGALGIGTTTPGSIFSIQSIANFQSGTSTIYDNLNVQGQLKVGTGSIYLNGAATSTFSSGIQGSALNLLTGGALMINGTGVLNATTLGSGVTASSLTSVGTITTGTWSGTTVAVNKGGTGVTTSTGTGNVVLSASPTFTGTVSVADITCTDCIGQGDIGASAIGTSELKTGTGSQSTSGGNVTMNDYSFFPNMDLDACDAQGTIQVTSVDVTNDTVGRFNMPATCTSGNVVFRWRYVTASDNPVIWVIADGSGALSAAWQSEDPINQSEHPANPNPLEGTSLQDDERFVNVGPPSVAELKKLYATLPADDRTAILAKLEEYVVGRRGWLSRFDALSDLALIGARYEPAARLWAVRFFAEQYDADPSAAIMQVFTVPDEALLAKDDAYVALQAYLAQRDAARENAAQPSAATSADLSEWYTSHTGASLTKGEIVAVSTEEPVRIVRASREMPLVVGVVSTAPHIVMGRRLSANDVPVALAGRVPVKFSDENGDVKIGDRITISSTPGVGMKAGPFDDSIGVVIGVETAQAVPTLMVFLDMQEGLDVQALADALTERNSLSEDSTPTATSSPTAHTSFANRFFSSLFARLTEWFADAQNGIVNFYASIVRSDRVETKQLCVDDVCVTRDEFLRMKEGQTAAAGAPTDIHITPSPGAPTGSPASVANSETDIATTTTPSAIGLPESMTGSTSPPLPVDDPTPTSGTETPVTHDPTAVVAEPPPAPVNDNTPPASAEAM